MGNLAKQKNLYLYRVTLTFGEEIKYYFGIRTCYCNPEDDFEYVGSPKANAFLWEKADKIKKDILISKPWTEENFKELQQKELEIIREAQKKYGIYEKDENEIIVNDAKCLNVGVYPTLAMTPTIKRKIGAKNSISQKGERNSGYGTSWINHLDFGPKRVKRELIPEYIEQGWYEGRTSFENRMASSRRSSERIAKRDKREEKFREKAVELFKKFTDGDFINIADFIKKSNYPHSRQNLIRVWKKCIPNFSKELVSHESPHSARYFSSKSGRRMNKISEKIESVLANDDSINDSFNRKNCNKNSKSGHVGVSQLSNGTWRADIGHDGIIEYLGVYVNKEDAITTRIAGEKKYQ